MDILFLDFHPQPLSLQILNQHFFLLVSALIFLFFQEAIHHLDLITYNSRFLPFLIRIQNFLYILNSVLECKQLSYHLFLYILLKFFESHLLSSHQILLNVCFDMFDLIYYLFALLNTFHHYMLLREHLFFLSYFPPIIVHLQSPFYFC